MKTILRLGYAVLVLVGINSAYAADVAVATSVGQLCQINAGTSSAIDMTGYAVNTPVAGVFKYQCNFAGGNTILRFTSANGGVKNGSNLADYGIFLNDQTPGALGAPNPNQWLRASNSTGAGVPFFNIAVPTAANVEQTPYFYVGLIQPVTVAGTYTDTLTITILP